MQFFVKRWCSILNVLIHMERKWRIYFWFREEYYLSEMNWYISVASKPSGLMSGSKILTNTLLNSGSSSFGTSILMASIQWDIALFQTSNVITSYGIKQKKRTKPETQKCSKLFVLTSLSNIIKILFLIVQSRHIYIPSLMWSVLVARISQCPPTFA